MNAPLPEDPIRCGRVEFRIERSLTADGLPTYELYRDLHTPITDSSRKIATNSDRAVLERAITFLKEG